MHVFSEAVSNRSELDRVAIGHPEGCPIAGSFAFCLTERRGQERADGLVALTNAWVIEPEAQQRLGAEIQRGREGNRKTIK
jgi:hypothetical protein